MSILSRLFGTCGVLHYRGVCEDGCTFKGKGSIETFGYSSEEIKDDLKEGIYVKSGKRVKEISYYIESKQEGELDVNKERDSGEV